MFSTAGRYWFDSMKRHYRNIYNNICVENNTSKNGVLNRQTALGKWNKPLVSQKIGIYYYFSLKYTKIYKEHSVQSDYVTR